MEENEERERYVTLPRLKRLGITVGITVGIIKSLFCRHHLRFVRKIYGDEINCQNGKRFEYECCKYGKHIFLDQPYNCVGCIHLYLNCCGGGECDRNIKPPDNRIVCWEDANENV